MAKKREDKVVLHKVRVAGKKRYRWHWIRYAPNGEIVGQSHAVFVRKIHCVINAKRQFEIAPIFTA